MSSSSSSGSGNGNDKMFERAIGDIMSSIIAGVSAEQLSECIEVPKNRDNGDLALPVAKLNRFSKLAGRPDELAQKWAQAFQPNDYIVSANATGPYVNFRINKQIMIKAILKQVFQEGVSFGSSTVGNGKTVVVEFSSPNIAKPFHAGHLRSTIIGNFLKNLFKKTGHNVIAINYLGDWGKQYGLLAVGYERYGSEQELLADPIRHLYEVYVKINEVANGNEEKKILPDPTVHDAARAYFRRMEDGDAAALQVWERFRNLSIEEYKRIYKRLNVEFDVYSGESLMTEGMGKSFDVLQKKGLLEENQGAQVINLEAEKMGLALVRKSDGTTLYITRDIAAAAGRAEEYHFDKMYYVVAAQQDLHFKQLFSILKKMEAPWAKDCTHINFGMVKGMSTRKGTVVFLTDILTEAKQTMLDQMKKNEEKSAEIEDPEAVADLVGLSAVIIQDMSAKRIKDYEFDWARVTSFEGDTGVYLQYAHARLCSMERKAGVAINFDADLSLLVEPEAHELTSQIGKFPEVVRNALAQLEPCTIVTYLFALAHAVSSAHAVLWVKDREPNLAQARMALFWAAKTVLGNGLTILGLVPLERM
eukprot:TRINITY_DN3397_c0_g1_i2.p1 TRINITY_DN3397_c0_g1~~TRINITY_DN3397_c0_g1_i2.p1  ORF type:complete len:589 (-),score=192.13 TRINITY_DN3397_c0_g1_i2:39-1805(-)